MPLPIDSPATESTGALSCERGRPVREPTPGPAHGRGEGSPSCLALQFHGALPAGLTRGERGPHRHRRRGAPRQQPPDGQHCPGPIERDGTTGPPGHAAGGVPPRRRLVRRPYDRWHAPATRAHTPTSAVSRCPGPHQPPAQPHGRSQHDRGPTAARLELLVHPHARSPGQAPRRRWTNRAVVQRSRTVTHQPSSSSPGPTWSKVASVNASVWG